jgi:hypothetical protein
VVKKKKKGKEIIFGIVDWLVIIRMEILRDVIHGPEQAG